MLVSLLETLADILKEIHNNFNVVNVDYPIFVLFLYGKNFHSIFKFLIPESNSSVALWLDVSNIIRVIILDYKQNKPSASPTGSVTKIYPGFLNFSLIIMSSETHPKEL